jgi:hypothetical protein
VGEKAALHLGNVQERLAELVFRMRRNISTRT